MNHWARAIAATFTNPFLLPHGRQQSSRLQIALEKTRGEILTGESSTKEGESKWKQAKEREKQELVRRRQAEERNRQTSFTELLQHCHDLLSRRLRVETPSRSTTGKIPLPTGKYCPTRLEYWADCPEQLLRVYRSVSQYLESKSAQAPLLFSSLAELEGLGRRFSRKPLRSEQDRSL